MDTKKVNESLTRKEQYYGSRELAQKVRSLDERYEQSESVRLQVIESVCLKIGPLPSGANFGAMTKEERLTFIKGNESLFLAKFDDLVDLLVRVADGNTQSQKREWAIGFLEQQINVLNPQSESTMTGGEWLRSKNWLREPQSVSAERRECGVSLIWDNDIIDRPDNWLLPNMFSMGELSLIAGQGGVGKTFFTCLLASLVTNGYQWQGASVPEGGVLFFAPEGRHDKFRNRLRLNSVNPERYAILEGKRVYCEKTDEYYVDPVTFADTAAIEKAFDEFETKAGISVKMLVADPIGSFMGDAKTCRDSDVRRVLKPLEQVAQRRDIALIFVAHTGKIQHQISQNRVLDSVGFVNMARAVWMVFKDPEDEHLRILAPSKGNDLIDPKAVSYRIVDGQVQVVDYGLDRHADDFVQQGQSGKTTKVEESGEWLQGLLADGSKPVKEIYELGEMAGYSKRTLNSAKKIMGIESTRESRDDVWKWKLQEQF